MPITNWQWTCNQQLRLITHIELANPNLGVDPLLYNGPSIKRGLANFHFVEIKMPTFFELTEDAIWCHQPPTYMELLMFKKKPLHMWWILLRRRGVDGLYNMTLQQSTMTIRAPFLVRQCHCLWFPLSSVDSRPSQYTTLHMYVLLMNFGYHGYHGYNRILWCPWYPFGPKKDILNKINGITGITPIFAATSPQVGIKFG